MIPFHSQDSCRENLIILVLRAICKSIFARKFLHGARPPWKLVKCTGLKVPFGVHSFHCQRSATNEIHKQVAVAELMYSPVLVDCTALTVGNKCIVELSEWNDRRVLFLISDKDNLLWCGGRWLEVNKSLRMLISSYMYFKSCYILWFCHINAT